MDKDSRSKMIESAAGLIGSRGLNAASFSEVLAVSGAPRGSIYHHFPEGKDQLAAEAVRWTSARVLAFQAAYAGTTPEGVLDRFVGMWRHTVEVSHGEAGCVVAGVAIDTVSSVPGLIELVRETFREWVALLARQLEATGVAPERAGAIATMAVAAMEGALILCRAEGGTAPLERVAAELKRLLPAAAE
ncbi:MAG TPA: TetR/AcrR family transcriptional regulator [Devosia sp.]|nr:TetR/AcrR family transcriptional regulator [Devosia sp.]